jgi:hypothetical protein
MFSISVCDSSFSCSQQAEFAKNVCEMGTKDVVGCQLG